VNGDIRDARSGYTEYQAWTLKEQVFKKGGVWVKVEADEVHTLVD
jgi:hypothetical protein